MNRTKQLFHDDLVGIFDASYKGDYYACIASIHKNVSLIHAKSNIKKYTLLELALWNHHHKLSHKFIELGADIHAVDEDGQSGEMYWKLILAII